MYNLAQCLSQGLLLLRVIENMITASWESEFLFIMSDVSEMENTQYATKTQRNVEDHPQLGLVCYEIILKYNYYIFGLLYKVIVHKEMFEIHEKDWVHYKYLHLLWNDGVSGNSFIKF